jgi:hypothetical protein
MRLTYADIRTPVSKVVNLCDTDSRVMDYVNQAIERLLWMGKYDHTYAKFAVTIGTSNTITWPRELESIERIAVGVYPIQSRSVFHEFIMCGFGLLSDTDLCASEMVDRSPSCTSIDITPGTTGVRIRLYPTLTVDINKVVTLQGLDFSGTEIRTEYPAASGTYIRGVNATTASPYVETTQLFSSLVSAQKPVTQGTITVKSYDPVSTALTTLAVWDPDDTNPEFRRSFIPGLTSSGQTTVNVIGKLAYRKIRNTTDWVIPPNLAAIKLMVRAIWMEENDQIQKAVAYEQKARQLLEEQMLHRMGGQQQVMSVDFGTHYGAGGIPATQ